MKAERIRISGFDFFVIEATGDLPRDWSACNRNCNGIYSG